jgi:hypothetical protein
LGGVSKADGGQPYTQFAFDYWLTQTNVPLEVLLLDTHSAPKYLGQQVGGNEVYRTYIIGWRDL